MNDVGHRMVETNGIRMRIGPPVLVRRGFAEFRHSWHHQLRALAEGGYPAGAPDMRATG